MIYLMKEEYRLYGQAKSRWFPTSAVQLLEDEFGASVWDCGEHFRSAYHGIVHVSGRSRNKDVTVHTDIVVYSR